MGRPFRPLLRAPDMQAFSSDLFSNLWLSLSGIESTCGIDLNSRTDLTESELRRLLSFLVDWPREWLALCPTTNLIPTRGSPGLGYTAHPHPSLRP